MNETRVLVERIKTAIAGLPRDPETLARAVDKACRDFARETGMKPDIECDFKEPGAQRHIPASNGWTVVFEAGPYDWAVEASMMIIHETGILCEPYYGFDLTFYRKEAAAA